MWLHNVSVCHPLTFMLIMSSACSEVSVVFGPDCSDALVHHLPSHFLTGCICISAMVLS